MLSGGALIRFVRVPTGKRIGFVLIFVAAMLAGFAYADWRAGLRLDDQLETAREGQDVVLEGDVADLPERTSYGLRFLFSMDTPPAGVPHQVFLSIYARNDGKAPLLRAGERWRFTARLRRAHGSRNPHGFDYEAWMFERNVRAVGYVRTPGDMQRIAELATGVDARVQRVRQVIRERFEAAVPQGEWVGVLSALAVGDQSSVSPAQWRLFNQTGVTHLMSISGGHVTFFAALLAWLVRVGWARVPALCLRLPAQKAAVLAGALAAFVYVLLAGFGVPAQRTLYMLLAVALGAWLDRGISPTRSLALGLLAVLLVDPWAVISPGFWLSFGAVAVLLWISASSGRTEQGMWFWLRAQWRAQWAVIVFSLPVLLGLFQQFSLISPIANAIAIPVISMIVTPLALLFAVLPMPSLAWLAHGVLSLLMKLLASLAALPLASWQQAAPPLWLIALCVAGGFWALLPRGVPARRLALLCCLPVLAWSPLRPQSGHFDATIIDVGQGLAVHVQTAGRDLLFDTGPQYSAESDSGERIIHPFLRAQGVRTLDRIVVSHDDSDHSGGAASLLSLIKVDEFMSSLPDDHVLVRKAGGQHPCRAGDRWNWDGVDFVVLHPAPDSTMNKDNDHSCVLRVGQGRSSLLIAADIEAKSEQEILLRDASVLASGVLVAPHHGSKTSSSPAFIEAVGAQTVVFTAGYRNRFHHPADEVVARYAATGAQLLRSDLDGAVSLHDDDVGLEIVTERAVRRRYWQGR